MIKKLELADSNSCLNKADDDEPIFVLLARDEAALYAVEEWVRARKQLGLNSYGDAKLTDALHWCDSASKWRDDNGR